MENELTSFRQFPTREAAAELQELLLQHGIEASLSGEENEFERLYFGSMTKSFYEVQIAASDFPKANQIVADAEKRAIEMIGKDYYLYEYSDKELWEIIEKYDEWSAFDFHLAQRILKERGHTVDATVIESMRYKRLDTLVQPEKVAPVWLAAAYIAAFMGGVLGVLFGYTIMTATKTLPDGNKVYTYTSKDRAHGKTIFYIGLIVLPISILTVIIRGFWIL